MYTDTVIKLRKEKANLEKVLEALSAAIGYLDGSNSKAGKDLNKMKKKTLSPEHIKKLVEGRRKAKKKRNLSEAGRQNIVAALKARHEANKAEKEKDGNDEAPKPQAVAEPLHDVEAL